MKTKRVIIEQDSIFDDVRMIGITSPLIDYKIAIAFDRAAGIRLDKKADICDDNGVPYSFYLYKFSNSQTSCNLIALNNKALNKSWLGPLSIRIDYLLIIRGDDATDEMAEKIKSKMSSSQGLNTYLIKSDVSPNMRKIVTKIEGNILEAAEMHELAIESSYCRPMPSNLKFRKLKKA